MSYVRISSLIWFLILVLITDGFVPHPSVRVVGQAGDSMSLNDFFFYINLLLIHRCNTY